MSFLACNKTSATCLLHVMLCLLQGVQGISDIITIPGLVNVDFADVKSIMCNSGTAMLGVGVSTGKNRAEEAAMVIHDTLCALLWAVPHIVAVVYTLHPLHIIFI